MASLLSRLLRRDPSRPMSCAEVGELLQEYLDDVLDDARAARLAAHLEECRRCGLEADTYRRIKQSLAERRGGIDVVADNAIARLRAFGEQLARGEHPHEH